MGDGAPAAAALKVGVGAAVARDATEDARGRKRAREDQQDQQVLYVAYRRNLGPHSCTKCVFYFFNSRY